MSGHSKWATTKRTKEKNDAKRGAIFTKLANVITVAAKNGADPEMNFALRMAIDRAKAANLPKENIERAIKKGAGGADATALQELLYEATVSAKGGQAGQVQLIIKCLTDNRNRTAAEIKHLLSKYNGQLAAVMWNFAETSVFMIGAEALKGHNWEELELGLIDLDILDIVKVDEGVTIYARHNDFQKIKQWLEQHRLTCESAEIEYVAKDKVANLSEADQAKVNQLIEALEDGDDVLAVYTNVT